MVQLVGALAEIWRYPVKSMMGERLGQVTLGKEGVDGDRRWAFVNAATKRVLSAKKWPQLLSFTASYQSSIFGAEDPRCPVITAPDGTKLPKERDEINRKISEVLGCQVELVRAQPKQSLTAEMDADTVFGDVPWELIKPSWVNISRAEIPDYFSLAPGSFFDAAPLHLLTSATLELVRGTSGPDAQVDARRFRPNLVVRTLPTFEGLCEEKWIGRTLRVGREAVVEVQRAVPRCVMTTHHQAELRRDLRILRAIANLNRGFLGVFCRIEREGLIHEGDEVLLCD